LERRAVSWALPKAGSNIAASIAMIAITTRSSMSVNFLFLFFFILFTFAKKIAIYYNIHYMTLIIAFQP
jgi:hypothetical protein